MKLEKVLLSLSLLEFSSEWLQTHKNPQRDIDSHRCCSDTTVLLFSRVGGNIKDLLSYPEGKIGRFSFKRELRDKQGRKTRLEIIPDEEGKSKSLMSMFGFM